jgi:predicted TIM-barrel fold metal-dependent hydrolase
MKIVDVHAHLYHPDWYPYRFQNQLAIDSLRRRRKQIDTAAAARELKTLSNVLSDRDGLVCLRVMDNVGIEKRLLHVIDWGLELGEPTCTIEEVHKAVLGVCRRHPDRLIGFAGVDPRRTDAVPLLTWAIDQLGAAGLKLHPTSRKWTLFDDCVAGLLEVVSERKLPVMVHTGKTVDVLTDVHCQPGALVQLANRFPGVDFIAGHSAFSSWRSFGPSPPPNLWFDISAWQDRLSLDADVLKRDVLDLLTAFRHRVFFATDSPFYGFNVAVLEAKWIAFIRQCAEELGPEALHSVFSGGPFARTVH